MGSVVRDVIRSVGRSIGSVFGGGGIPFKSDVVFWLDGTIIEIDGSKYFRDRSGNGHHILITDYDFDSTWDKGYPYKSAATISAPVDDATLYSEDINNFLYSEDSAGTVNQIPVNSLFQDIDYEHKLFCRHVDQVLDDDDVETYEPRVLDIVLYANVKSGADLTTCQSYYGVPIKQTVNIREVGTGKTYATIALAITAAAANDVIYVYSGIYAHFTLNKTLTVTCVGNVRISDSYGANITFAANDCIVTGMTIINPTLTYTVIVNANRTNCTIRRCYFSGCVNYALSSGTGCNGFLFDQSVLISSGTYLYYFQSTWQITNSYLYSNVSSKIDNGTTMSVYWKYNKVICNSAAPYASITTNSLSYILSYNTIAVKPATYFLQITGTSLTLECNYNKLTLMAGTSFINNSYAIICNGIIGNKVNIPSNSTFNGIVYKIYSPININVYNNIFTDSVDNSVIEGTFIRILYADGETTTCNIYNNYIYQKNGSGYAIGIGYDSTTTNVNKVHGIDIYNNILIGRFTSTVNTNGLVHGIFVGFNIDAKVHHNYIDGMALSIVFKANGEIAFTSGGAYYNICINTLEGVLLKGIDGVSIYGNTIYSLLNNSYGVYITENDDYIGKYCDDIIIKNNILKAYYSIYIADSAPDLISNYNILYGNSNYVVNLVGVLKTLETWQVLGYDTNSLNQNPTFKSPTEFWPIPAITGGEDLGTDYDDGLDITTDWGSDTQVPVVVTKQQGVNWQIGAYVQ